MGDHIDQRGSLVAQEKLRFDFSHKAGVTTAEMQSIESMSQDWVKRDVKVYSTEMDLSTSQKIPGLRAVFGESYPDPVRVVTLEYDASEKKVDDPEWRKTSVEFCGGTYVDCL